MREQVKILRTRWVPIDSVTPHPENARRADTERIRQSLEDHAQYAPIVVHDETKQVIAHNHVWAIAKELGHPKIYATFVECSTAKARAVLAADNRTSDSAGYEDAALLELLSNLDDTGLLLEGGWDGGALDELRTTLEGDVAPATRLDDGTVDSDLRNVRSSEVRSITITVSDSAYARLIEQLDHLQAHFETANYSDTVVAVTNEYMDQIGRQ
jgi:hypothetical protein